MTSCAGNVCNGVIVDVPQQLITTDIIKVTSDEVGVSDLTGYRLSLLKSTAENLLRAAGYKLSATEGDEWIHFSTKSCKKENDTGSRFNVLCGAVINSETKMKETQITTTDYHSLRLKDMQAVLENKYAETSNEDLLHSLTDASIKISLLQVKPSQTVSLNLNPKWTGPRETASKGGAFLQYNSSRLAAIRKKYQQRVDEKIYPEIPEPENLDFDVLKEPEEWVLLFNFLLEYPYIIDNISREMVNHEKANVHQFCNFLSKLCSLFSVYYRRVRILLEPRDHLFPIIQARLLLAMSVEQILENALTILNIKKVEEM